MPGITPVVCRRWPVPAWCLRPNHFHLVLATPQPTLVAGLKWLLGTYTEKGSNVSGKGGAPYAGARRLLRWEDETRTKGSAQLFFGSDFRSDRALPGQWPGSRTFCPTTGHFARAVALLGLSEGS